MFNYNVSWPVQNYGLITCPFSESDGIRYTRSDFSVVLHNSNSKGINLNKPTNVCMKETVQLVSGLHFMPHRGG